MAFAAVLGSSLRLSSLRATGRRFATRQSNLTFARSLSLLAQPYATHRQHLLLLVPRHNGRLASTTSTSVATVPTAEGTPAVVEVSSSAAQDVVVSSDATAGVLTDMVLSHTPTALQYGDLAALGLASWSPAGIVRWSLELINVATGLPWFWTIVAGSLFWRAILVPFTIKGLRNSAKLLPLQPKILQAQKEMDAIRQSGDKLALQRHALKMRKMYKDAGVNLGASALMPFVQIPVTLGMFFGVKTMCEFPLPQLMDSGLDILPNLTVADPYLALPIALCAAVNLQIYVGAYELNLRDRPEMGHIMNGLRLLSVASIWFMSALPSGLMVALLTTSLGTTTQSLILQRSSVRKALDIPQVPAELRGKLPSPIESAQYVIAKWRSKLEEARVAAQHQQRRKL